jgi:riboflavin kinase / FMN adenylyltransferase
MATYLFDWKEPAPNECREGALTFGNFDGVHRGHSALVQELRRQSRASGGPAVAVTFDPHPLQLLQPARFQPLLTTPHDRAQLLQACGADHVLILRTSPDLLQLSADEFFRQVIVSGLAARAVVEGPNFGFGRNREGNVDTLSALCGREGLGLTIVPPLLGGDGRAVSSSRVRDALVRGDVHAAAALLGRPYRLRGRVGVGQRRGQTLGFPTANLKQVPTLVPGDGVYAVRTLVGETSWPGAANVGPNPTFGEQARKIEVHLIGFEGDLYGQEVAVEFLERLRDTRPFAGPQQLVEQLRRDVEQARLAALEADVLERVKKILAEEVGPALHLDGTAVEVLDLTDGVLRVNLANVCAGCPSTVMTVVMGIEQELRRRIPEIEYLEALP